MKLTRKHRIPDLSGISVAVALTMVFLFNAPIAPRVLAQESVAANPSSAAGSKLNVASAGQDKKAEAGERSAVPYSSGIEDILKMARAGVSKEVMAAFVKHSTTGYQPTSADIIALKEQAVPDEVITVLLQRVAEVKAQTNRMKRTVAVPSIVRDLSTPGNLDPESYDFWFYHYAYPRALSYSYRTLPPYYPNYRLGPSRTFPPASRFSHSRNYWK